MSLNNELIDEILYANGNRVLIYDEEKDKYYAGGGMWVCHPRAAKLYTYQCAENLIIEWHKHPNHKKRVRIVERSDRAPI